MARAQTAIGNNGDATVTACEFFVVEVIAEGTRFWAAARVPAMLLPETHALDNSGRCIRAMPVSHDG